MSSWVRAFAPITFAASLMAGGAALAQSSDAPLKIGLLVDFASVYSDIGGNGSVASAKMAIEEFGGTMFGKPIEVVIADPQMKPDIASSIARKWYETENVDLIVGLPSSAMALAAIEMSKRYEKLMILTEAASSDLVGKYCTPYSLQWTYDTYSNAYAVSNAVVKKGGDSWFFITADYAGGHAIERDAAAVVTAAKGQVLGSTKHPLNTADFSSYLLRAQASKAKVIGLANVGGDAINTVKQATEFGIVAGGQKLAATVMFITDIHSLGLKMMQGVITTESFYWDKNDQTREFGKKFFERIKRMPTMNQVGTYSAVLHYLKAVKAAGSRDTKTVLEKMRELPVRDAFTDNGYLREDGRMVHSLLLLEVKKPEESKYPWDYYKVLAEVSGDEAIRPMKGNGCPLVKDGVAAR
jgi:branched-chain amino acid transport system substrate-binding protein